MSVLFCFPKYCTNIEVSMSVLLCLVGLLLCSCTPSQPKDCALACWLESLQINYSIFTVASLEGVKSQSVNLLPSICCQQIPSHGITFTLHVTVCRYIPYFHKFLTFFILKYFRISYDSQEYCHWREYSVPDLNANRFRKLKIFI